MKNNGKNDQLDMRKLQPHPPLRGGKGKNRNTGAYRDGHHVNSRYWKNYKKSQPNELPKDLFDICVGSILGDSTLYAAKKDGAKIKFEQGYKHKAYVEELWTLFEKWTFYEAPRVSIRKTGKRAGQDYSYYFRTFAHPAFRPLKDIFLDENNKKVYKAGTIIKHLSPLGLRYWVADDGSLQKNNETILNTQAFTKEMNMAMSAELNNKFKLHSKVVPSKQYWAIYIPASDAPVQRELLQNLPSSMMRKLPKLKNQKKGRWHRAKAPEKSSCMFGVVTCS